MHVAIVAGWLGLLPLAGFTRGTAEGFIRMEDGRSQLQKTSLGTQAVGQVESVTTVTNEVTWCACGSL